MVTVARCQNLFEADRLKMVLENAGIPAFIPDELTAGIAPQHFLTGVRLQVAEENAEEAGKIIEAEQQEGS
jgi:hypothetical protein